MNVGDVAVICPAINRNININGNNASIQEIIPRPFVHKESSTNVQKIM